MADRAEYTMHTTEVSHVARPEGAKRESPPHLHDFREFVEACDGLSDDMPVTITAGSSDGTGRKNLTFSVRKIEPVVHPEDESEQYHSWLRRFSSGFSEHL
jgi:hypothetical protein